MINKFIVGSQLYGLTNQRSDTDYLYLYDDINTFTNSELNSILLDKNIELIDYYEFKQKLYKHDLKALEVYYNYYNQVINLIPELVNFTINNQLLRRSISATCSNSDVKARKKIRDSEVYVGRKSFFHVYRILYMYLPLARQESIISTSKENILTVLQYSSETVQSHLRPIYEDIVLSHCEDTTMLYDSLKTKYSPLLKPMMHELRILCPLDKDKKGLLKCLR